MSDFKLEIEKEFSVPADMIYDAWLNPESVGEWMCPADGVKVPNPVIDARVGGRFELNMDVGAEIIPHKGEYKKLDRPNVIQFTWNSPATNDEDSLVTITIEETGVSSCLLKLVHEKLPTESSMQNHTEGWTNILKTLGAKVSK